MHIKRIILTLALLWGFLPAAAALVPAAPAFAAYNPLDKACSGSDAKNSTTCNENSQDSTKIVGSDGIVVRVTRIVAAIGGIVAIIMIIIYGIQLITSYGDSGKATAARNGIISACIGLVVIVLAQAIVVFIISNI